jgi:uncharacterized protein (DUF488 family)
MSERGEGTLTRGDSHPLDRQSPIIYTIGHSTRSLDKFVGLLEAHCVRQLGDIRTVPRSRRHPHFAIDALSVSLPRAGIAYRHFPGLGGLRKPRADSPNTAWRHSGFRGYADYMATPAFEKAIEQLLEFASASASGGFEGGAHRTAIMCAEAVWWRCHRQLVADALVARGVEVRHISTDRTPPPHELTDFARVDGLKVSYPGLIR